MVRARRQRSSKNVLLACGLAGSSFSRRGLAGEFGRLRLRSPPRPGARPRPQRRSRTRGGASTRRSWRRMRRNRALAACARGPREGCGSAAVVDVAGGLVDGLGLDAAPEEFVAEHTSPRGAVRLRSSTRRERTSRRRAARPVGGGSISSSMAAGATPRMARRVRISFSLRGRWASSRRAASCAMTRCSAASSASKSAGSAGQPMRTPTRSQASSLKRNSRPSSSTTSRWRPRGALRISEMSGYWEVVHTVR